MGEVTYPLLVRAAMGNHTERDLPKPHAEWSIETEL